MTNVTELAYLFPANGTKKKSTRAATPGLRKIHKNYHAKFDTDAEVWEVFGDAGEWYIGCAEFIHEAVELAIAHEQENKG